MCSFQGILLQSVPQYAHNKHNVWANTHAFTAFYRHAKIQSSFITGGRLKILSHFTPQNGPKIGRASHRMTKKYAFAKQNRAGVPPSSVRYNLLLLHGAGPKRATNIWRFKTTACILLYPKCHFQWKNGPVHW